MNPSKLYLAIIAGLFPSVLFAQEIIVAQKDKATIDDVYVTTTRSKSSIDKTPANISIIHDQELTEKQTSDIKKALRYEPGITVRKSAYRTTSAAAGGGRGGNESINIRGLEGNRVLIMEDGVSLPASFNFGSFTSGRGDYANTSLYKRVEILRGPTSALWGSDGLTGAINFVTKDPQDLLDTFNKPYYLSLQSAYDSATNGNLVTATGALGNEKLQGMLVFTGNLESETKNKGSTGGIGALRTDPNPQDIQRGGVLGKFVYHINPNNRLKLTAEATRQRIDSEALSAEGEPILASMPLPKIVNLTEHDSIKRNKAILSYQFDDDAQTFLQHATVSMFYQDSNNRQSLDELRSNSMTRWRFNNYEEKTIGLSTYAQGQIETGSVTQRLSYGLDGKQSTIKSFRNGNLPSVGDPLPAKAFPDSKYITAGAFVQDEIQISKLSIIPAIRFDYYKIKPDSDDPLVYGAQSNTANDHAFSPRLALMYEFTPGFVPYVQYAKGFRAPTPDEINSNFSNLTHGYATIPNPDLKPETSNTYEIGFKGNVVTQNSGTFRYGVASFYGKYNDFISREIVSKSGAYPITYQFVNQAEATIKGAEARFSWRHNSGFSTKLGVAYAKGTTKDKDSNEKVALDSINPLSVNLGLRYEPNDTWFVGTDMMYQSAKKQDNVSNKNYYLPPSVFVMDLNAGYHINKYASIYAGINNIFDKKYWNWSDVRGITNDSKIKDFYTATGRSFNIGFKVEY
ncbi:TonB-dependent hemoglobin/transferrin/lactoferrin family receptor [Neisseria sp. Ec49-e6-T10]|uniref:TonB-dependent hemoglobin/transferrin/lactoferrin family receptor n=1 Tax=Neisseria sp. Ec49-e6-T10 TaxID=3140744 RepID=UPI003EB779F2